MRAYRDNSAVNGYLLHRRQYRETSYLLDFFSLEQGKVSAVARGVRGSKNERKSLLQPFQPLLFGLSGRHELKNLGQLETARNRLSLQGKNLYCGMYLNELINRTLPLAEPYPHLFARYVHALEQLQHSQCAESVLREFEFSLLLAMGYMPDLSQDWQTGQALQAGLYYTLVPEHGLQQVKNAQMPRCFSTETLVKIQQLQWDADSLAAAKVISRIALRPLLGTKPLKSRELFVSP